MKRGEVWWVSREDAPSRPYLIMTRDPVIPVINKILAVPITSRRRPIATQVPLDRDDGMRSECAASFDNLELVAKHRFIERLTELGPVKMLMACRALAIATGCD